MGTRVLLLVMLVFSMTFVVSQAETTFQLNEDVNYRFRCYDNSGSYCTSTTVLLGNVEYPNGTNALDNVTLSYQNTYFNLSLPTDAIGENYLVLIHSPTSNNTITEFSYDVTATGNAEGTSYILANLSLLFVILFLMGGYHYTTRKIDFEKLRDRVVKKYENKNPIKGFFLSLYYSLLKDKFLFYYLLGWPLLLIIEDLLRTFNVTVLQTLTTNIIDFYSIGIYVALALFVGSAWQFLKSIWDELENIKWGVNE